MGILRVDHVEVYSSDIDRTLDFYVNTLGFTLWRRTESGRDDGFSLHQACVRLGDMMVEIIEAEPEAVDQPVDQSKMGLRMFALRVDDMAKTVEYLESKGVEFFQAGRGKRRSLKGSGPRFWIPTAYASNCGSGRRETASTTTTGNPPSPTLPS